MVRDAGLEPAKKPSACKAAALPTELISHDYGQFCPIDVQLIPYRQADSRLHILRYIRYPKIQYCEFADTARLSSLLEMLLLPYFYPPFLIICIWSGIQDLNLR